MNDNINRADALEACHPVMPTDGVGTIGLTYEDIKNLPAADVVEVVRCKDCKYFRKWNSYFGDNGKEYGGGACCKNEPHGKCFVYLDDYCSDAVRREEG